MWQCLGRWTSLNGQNNYDMALWILLNTEKWLLKNPEIGEAYSNIISQYLEKGYIRRRGEVIKKLVSAPFSGDKARQANCI